MPGRESASSADGSPPELPRLLFVGAFPPANRAVFGGMVTDCRALLGSSLPRRVTLDLVDTTQASQPPPGFLRRLLLAVRRFFRYVGRLERGRPDAVLLFTAAGGSVVEKGAMAWYARLRGIPALMFPRAGRVLDACQKSRFTRWWVRGAFAGARTVMCMGETWQKFAQETLGFDAADTPIIANWTATDELLALGAARAPASRPVRLLFVGWVDHEKGVAELLEACRVLAKDRRFELTLVGEGNMSREAKDFVAKHGLESVIHLAGWRSGADLLEAYARADVFVLPSWSEGLPNSMVEAMAAGLACVVSTVGSVPDVVEDGESALLVAPRDVDALQRALERVIDDPQLRARLGAAAHAIAACDFGVEQAVDDMLLAMDAARESLIKSGGGETIGWKLRKLRRYMRIYGPGRTWFKIAARLRVGMPRLHLRRRNPDIGMIGCGQFAYATIGYFVSRAFGARFAACFDIDSKAAGTFARGLGVARRCASADELLALPGLKLVYVASNHASHADYAVAALARGLDVYVEKPVAVTMAQLAALESARRSSRSRLFAGYNRPFSAALRDYCRFVPADTPGGISLQCFVSGHLLAPDHWYRLPAEGTRICGNVGHWLDLFVHLLARRGHPRELEIALVCADDAEPDDNLSISMRSDRGDLCSIMLSSRTEPFEGINETINLQHGDSICKIDDFRRLQLWQGTRLVSRRYWPKDVGHKLAILQPFRQDARDWQEVLLSTLLMLYITGMVRDGARTGHFSFEREVARLESAIAQS